MILAPSVDKFRITYCKTIKDLSCEIASQYGRREIPVVEVQLGDDDKEARDLRTTEGKLRFLTFHGAKGLERDCVIVIGFNSDYFDHFATEASHSTPNEPLYVAMTRARRCLCLVDERTSRTTRTFAFMPRRLVDERYPGTQYDVALRMQPSKPIELVRRPDALSVTTFLKKCDHGIYRAIERIRDAHVRVDSNKLRKLRIKATTSGHAQIPRGGGRRTREEVSDLTGIMIPIKYACDEHIWDDDMCEDLIADRCAHIAGSIGTASAASIRERYWDRARDQEPTSRDGTPEHVFARTSNLARFAAIHAASMNAGSTTRLDQIKNWNWIEDIPLADAVERMRREFARASRVPPELRAAAHPDVRRTVEYEARAIIGHDDDVETVPNRYGIYRGCLINGFIDCVIARDVVAAPDAHDEITYYEIKCVRGGLTDKHIAQILMYAWITFGRDHPLSQSDACANVRQTYRLFNVLDGSRIELVGLTRAVLDDFVARLIADAGPSDASLRALTDEEFIAKTHDAWTS
jgi:hypothetical protein